METVQARNSLDALVHSVQKSLSEYGDKVGADEKAKIESALKSAEELLKQKDAAKETLEAKAEELAKAAQKLGEMMYAQAQGAQGAGAQPGAGPQGGAQAGDAGKQQDEKVVDAEFTEVKSDRK
jgi:molecular chaperone DnaK